MADVTAHLRKLLPEAHIGVSEKKVWTTPNMKCDNLRHDFRAASRPATAG
jgi:hypothetical protein